MSLPGGIAPLPASTDRGIATSILGSLFATILYGLTSHQAFRYLRVFQGDPSYLKVLVTVLWTLLTISSMSIMHLNYYYFVTKRSQVEFLSDAVWSVDVIIVTSCAITCASRLFFAQRLHILTTLRYFISAPIAAAVFVRAGELPVLIFRKLLLNRVHSNAKALCIAYICRGLQMWGRDSVAEKLYGTGLAISVVADTTIAAMLSYYLAKGKRKFTSYDNHFDRILTYTVNAGILATFFSLTTVICMYTTNSLLVTIALCHLTDQLYVNSVMTVVRTSRPVSDPLEWAARTRSLMESKSIHRSVFAVIRLVVPPTPRSFAYPYLAEDG
ncbi:hypothetical protein SCHPADRAFT_935568 [Schizopora paradoxa]|uniref:DUF6534 domain-containing protein n=1 Tax=Schizopora paradoxa TaxID=27342 RepID=A0A0H2SBY5_9AGAM|nr:hypothetical protein SCHPADRAFT_935568 [Schizopora paradoxa]